MQGLIKVDENFIVSCLKNHNNHLMQVQGEIIKTYEEIVSKNNLIETLQVGVNLENSGGGKTSNHRDLGNIVENVKIRQEAYIEELYLSIEHQQLVEDAVRRVWICYESLDFEAKDILKRLHIDNAKWDYVPLEFNISKGTLVKRRNAALAHIMMLYESNYSNADIIHLSSLGQKKQQRKQPKKKQDNLGQLKLNLEEQGGKHE